MRARTDCSTRPTQRFEWSPTASMLLPQRARALLRYRPRVRAGRFSQATACDTTHMAVSILSNGLVHMYVLSDQSTRDFRAIELCTTSHNTIAPARAVCLSAQHEAANTLFGYDSYASTGGQLHTRFRSPYMLSIRATVGQTFRARSPGAGNAARSREYGRSQSSATTCASV